MFFTDCGQCGAMSSHLKPPGWRWSGGIGEPWGTGHWLCPKCRICPDCSGSEDGTVDCICVPETALQYPNLDSYPELRAAIDIYADETPNPIVIAKLMQEAHWAVKGFDRPEDGSGDRYRERRLERPWASHTFWWIIHNTVAHPLITIPWRPFFQFHDWTSRKMHGQ